MRDACRRAAESDEHCFLCEGSPLLVLLAARDLIHAGWRLLHHPLYGNWRPHQQPYRTALLAISAGPAPSGDDVQLTPTDPDSLHFIEEALGLFSRSRILTPDMTPPLYLKDCAELDLALMSLPLRQAGLPDRLNSAA